MSELWFREAYSDSEEVYTLREVIDYCVYNGTMMGAANGLARKQHDMSRDLLCKLVSKGLLTLEDLADVVPEWSDRVDAEWTLDGMNFTLVEASKS